MTSAILWDLGEDMLGTVVAGLCKRTAKEGSRRQGPCIIN